MAKPVLLLHGGAGTWKVPRKRVERAVKAISEARDYAWEYLLENGALKAVVEAIAYMEDTGCFNAGSGSVLNLVGVREMDAGLMDGSRGVAGAVACVKYPKNPIRLAYTVLEKTDHVLVVGDGADDLARRTGLEGIGELSSEVVERYRGVLRRYREGGWSYFRKNLRIALETGLMDTIGAVALDSSGCLVAGVSTGGVWLKLPGRVGDSAIPGAGFYADKYVALAASGLGEVIMYSLPCLRISEFVRQGYSLEKSMDAVVDWVTRVWGGDNIGIIGIDYCGEHYIAYNTKYFLVSYRDLEGGYTRFLGEDTRV